MTWKTRTYIVGWLLGTLLGLLSAYLFVRSAEEENNSPDEVSLSVGTMLSLSLAILGLIRQIAEASKPKKK